MKPLPRCLLLLLALMLAPLAHAESVVQQWVTRYNGPANGNDQAKAVAVDGSGNVVVTGYSFNGSGYDFYTAKYAAADGSLLWAQRHAGSGNSYLLPGVTMVLDSSGNVVVTVKSYSSYNYTAKYAAADGSLLWEQRYYGYVPTAVAVDGAGNVVVTGYSSNGSNYDYVTLKYAASDGSLLWDHGFNGLADGDDTAEAVAVDGTGNVVVTGTSFNGSKDDYYTAKYAAADGSLLWEQRYSGSANGFDEAVAVAVDGSGNVAVTGSSSNGSSVGYVTAKYRATDGSLLWAQRYAGPSNNDNYAHAVAVDGSGNVVVTGSSSNAGNGGNSAYATAKYAAADGSLLWVQRYSGLGGSNTSEPGGYGVVVDGSGNVVVTGYSSNASYRTDYYTAKYAAVDGSLLWEQRYDGPFSFDDVVDGSKPLALTPDGGVVVAGYSDGVDAVTQLSTGTDYATVKYLTLTAPVVTASAATGLTTTAATLHGTVNPGNVATTAQFEYGPSTSYGSTASITLAPNNGGLTQTVSAALSGLAAHTTYHFRVSASNSQGTTLGNDQTFTTTSNTPPTLSLPASPLLVVATSGSGAAVTFSATANDAEDGALTPTVTPASGSIFAVGDTTVNVSATDSGGAATNGSFVVRVQTPLQDWKLTNLGDANAPDLGDPDGDGLTTLAEYALVLPPGTASLPPGASRFTYAEGERLRLTLSRDPARNDVTIEVQAGDSPAGPWTSVATSTLGAPFTGAGYVGGDAATPGVKTVEVRDVVNLTDAPQRFLRVRVTK